MLTAPPRRGLELLVAGALTIDRFDDGSAVAGGSVLHAARAMALDGRRVAVATVAGPEDVARAGVAELGSLAEASVQPADRTVIFHHREAPAGRQLAFGGPGGRLTGLAATEPDRPAAILYAPVADELGTDAFEHAPEGAVRGAVLQGWLRSMAVGAPLGRRSPDDLDPTLVSALGNLDLLVASVEDLPLGGGPDAGLAALRHAFGERPVLALTAGTDGAWLQPGGGIVQHVPIARPVAGVSTVGAGDAFAAGLLAAMGRGVNPLPAARDAAALVAELLAERTRRRVFVIGDVHGMHDRLVQLLRDAGLVDAAGGWAGRRDELWLLGDLVDRGPDGIEVVRLLMRLEREAAAVGGRVGTVLGNHEILILAARQMADLPAGGPGGTFLADWLANGGQPADLAALGEAEVGWLRSLPAMARVGCALLLHADAPLYGELGTSIAEANETVAATLANPDPMRWDRLLGGFSARREFAARPRTADELLERFGGRLLVHGHTPVAGLTGAPPHEVREAHRYAGGRVVAADPGMPAGGPGFVYRLPAC